MGAGCLLTYCGFSHFVDWPETVHAVPGLHFSEEVKRSFWHVKSDFLSSLQAVLPLTVLSQTSPRRALV